MTKSGLIVAKVVGSAPPRKELMESSVRVLLGEEGDAALAVVVRGGALEEAVLGVHLEVVGEVAFFSAHAEVVPAGEMKALLGGRDSV